MTPCSKCSGDGMILAIGGHVTCPTCKGTGTMPTPAHIYIKGNSYIEIQADWSNMATLGILKTLEKKYVFSAQWDNNRQTYTIPITYLKELEDHLRTFTTVFLHNAARVPAESIVLRVEYIGACKRRQQQLTRSSSHKTFGGLCTTCGSTNFFCSCDFNGVPLSYATAWTNGGWNAQFPEKVLREFFPLEEKFNGDFYKALLKGSDLSKEYKKLARQFHPDLNRKRDSEEMFKKLQKAYGELRDPKIRKRYEAGLRFQVDHAETEVGFRVPKVCGDVTVEADYAQNGHNITDKIVVSKILSWQDVYDDVGRVMCSSWNHPAIGDKNAPPFTITYEYPGGFQVDV